MKVPFSPIFSILISSFCYPTLADSEEDWWHVFTGDEISNGDALLFFQARVQNEVGGEYHYCPILSAAIGADESTVVGRERLDYFRTWFRELKVDFDQQTANETRKVLCTEGWEDWGFDEIVEGMEKRSSASARFLEEDYERTLKVMSEVERAVFLRYMQNLKNASSITKYDTRGFYKNTASDITSKQAALCEKALMSHDRSFEKQPSAAGTPKGAP
jgi:hypothetical protein